MSSPGDRRVARGIVAILNGRSGNLSVPWFFIIVEIIGVLGFINLFNGSGRHSLEVWSAIGYQGFDKGTTGLAVAS